MKEDDKSKSPAFPTIMDTNTQFYNITFYVMLSSKFGLGKILPMGFHQPSGFRQRGAVSYRNKGKTRVLVLHTVAQWARISKSEQN